ncbi:MAG TPA: hypothetical protein VK826_02500 [Bacteroidia bacterium]|nr:hypothetical protein [Bacteroidia bacterium]
MKNFFCFTLIALALVSCGTSEGSHQDAGTDSINPVALFTLSDAEKILGQPAALTDSGWTRDGNISTYRSTYTGNNKDQNGKLSVLYCLFEQHVSDSSAKQTYAAILKANADHEGIEERGDLGDEAYFHSDKENFCFIFIRKGNRLIRMKVNKLTDITSLDEFNRVAEKIVSQI